MFGLVGILVLFLSGILGQDSPCPEVFQYQRQSNGEVYGTITLPYDGSTELSLGVNASMKGYHTDNKRVVSCFNAKQLQRIKKVIFLETKNQNVNCRPGYY